MAYTIVRYQEQHEKIWDEFIKQQSINGTFLQERAFLNYHGKDKFKDVSLLFFLENELVALCPACEIIEEGKKVFYSHQGSTYGGFVVKKSIYKTEKILQLLQEFEEYLIQEHYDKCILKPTMKLLCKENVDLLEFCLYYRHYNEYKELNLYIDYDTYNEDILSNLSHMKQRIVKKCFKEGLVMREITTEEEIKAFYTILEKNLKKFDTKPVHTTNELLDLYWNRIPGRVKFYGAYLQDKIVAGTMVFLFEETMCVHTQYLAADLDYNKLSPMSFVYYSVAKIYKELGYKTLSWGITTEHLGKEINMGLTKNKEDYGSGYVTNYIYEKELGSRL